VLDQLPVEAEFCQARVFQSGFQGSVNTREACSAWVQGFMEMMIRCKSFSMANEPGGVKYFSTKDDTDFNEYAFVIGSGEAPPGLEEGMMGMHKGSLRRIKLLLTMVFAAKKKGQLPLPTTKDGKRRFEQLFKTDATLLFEVLVMRVN